jgi:hypothetical protein
MKTTPTNPGLFKLISRLLMFAAFHAIFTNKDKKNK